jgi:hypothetical protein
MSKIAHFGERYGMEGGGGFELSVMLRFLKKIKRHAMEWVGFEKWPNDRYGINGNSLRGFH